MTIIAIWVGVAVGWLLAAASAVWVAKISLNHAMFASVIERSLAAGQRERVAKLCKAVPDAPMSAVVKQLLETSNEGAARTHDKLEAELTRTLERAIAAEAPRIAKPRATAWLAILVLVSTVLAAIALGEGLTATATLAGAAGILVAAWAAYTAAKALTTLEPETARLIPAFVSPPRIEASPVERVKDGATALTIASYDGETLLERESFCQSIIKIGKDPRSHIVVDDPSAARMHAVIEVTSPDDVTAIDLGNQPATKLNGVAISKSKLVQGDALEIGGVRLVIERVERADASFVAGVIPARLPYRSAGAAPAKEAEPTETIYYGFGSKMPDLFFEVITSLGKEHLAGSGVRIGKLRRATSADHAVVVRGSRQAVEKMKGLVRSNAEERYRSFLTPSSEIAPESIYTAETSSYRAIDAEIAASSAEIVGEIVL